MATSVAAIVVNTVHQATAVHRHDLPGNLEIVHTAEYPDAH